MGSLGRRLSQFSALPLAEFGDRLIRQLSGAAPSIQEVTRYAVHLKVTQLVLAELPNALILKGLPLAELSAISPQTRWTADIDLLVDIADVAHCIRRLQLLGFQQDAELRPWAYNQVSMTQPDWHVTIEVHWAIALPMFPSPTFNDLTQRSQIVRVKDVSIPTLGMEDMVIHLALHFVQHLGELRIAADLAGLLDQWESQIDIDRLHSIAREHKLKRIVALALAVADRDDPAPDPIARAIADSHWDLWMSGQQYPTGSLVDYLYQLLTASLLDGSRVRATLRGVVLGPHRAGDVFARSFPRMEQYLKVLDT